jgi:NADPH:quinone reductase-like Zn-dependent oxidoreductase
VTIDETALRVVERPNPIPGAGEVVVRVAAAGLNAADLLQRRGFYPAPPGWPSDVPGLELAGTVAAVGPDVDEGLVGARVCAIVGGGAQATHCVVPAKHLLRVPASVDDVAAGAFAEGFTTAYDALVRQADLRAGERVLISGGAGGVGTAAIQLAALLGAHSIAVVRDTTHAAALRELGANEVTTTEELGTDQDVDVILELVGAANLETAQRRLAPRSRVVVIGVGGGARASIDLLTVMGRRATITGSTLRARDLAEKAEIAAAMTRDVLPAWESGQLRVPISATYALDDVEAAYEAFAQPGKLGKFVLTTS